MQGNRGEDAARADNQELLGGRRRDHGLQGGEQMRADRELVELVHWALPTTKETMGQADRAQGETAGEHATLPAQDRDLQTAAAEVEGENIGIGLVGRIGADARRRQPGFHLA